MAMYTFPNERPSHKEKCGRTACQTEGATFFNPHTGKFYCAPDALAINEALQPWAEKLREVREDKEERTPEEIRALAKVFSRLPRAKLLEFRNAYAAMDDQEAEDLIEEELDAREQAAEDRSNGIYPDGATVVEDYGRYDRNNPNSPWAY